MPESHSTRQSRVDSQINPSLQTHIIGFFAGNNALPVAILCSSYFFLLCRCLPLRAKMLVLVSSTPPLLCAKMLVLVSSTTPLLCAKMLILVSSTHHFSALKRSYSFRVRLCQLTRPLSSIQMAPQPVEANQSFAQGVSTKNPFFQIFFYYLPKNDLRALSTSGGILFSHQMRNPLQYWRGASPPCLPAGKRNSPEGERRKSS